MTRKCVSLFSGGLDSMLALAIMARMGFEVTAYHGVSIFHDKGDGQDHIDEIRNRCFELGAHDVVCTNMNQKMIAFTKNPQYGIGSMLNACVDCRVMNVLEAKRVMEEVGAGFLVTGEVLGQRPMSQKRNAVARIDKILRGHGLDGLLLRPLSAKLLDPTIPEKEGWVDREKLYELYGRNRRPQMEMAEEFGITSYPAPAGGCLLTDPGFCIRMQEEMETDPEWDEEDVRWLRCGRHYRISPTTKIIVSRNEAEGNIMFDLMKEGDIAFIAIDRPGAFSVIHGPATDEARRVACGLAVYYSKLRDQGEARICLQKPGQEMEDGEIIGTMPVVTPEEVDDIYVGTRK
ncbi:MAG: ATP-binding protein [Planctomycetes bacterium]|nr:ATP-binding protein [Planctomycetota bacterium]